VLPSNHAEISTEKILAESDTLLLTWQKMPFSDRYEVEVAKEPTFAAALVKEMVSDNFYVLRSPDLGTYYWRVKSIGGQLLSKPSTPFEFKVK
jgi:hypothetical protein